MGLLRMMVMAKDYPDGNYTFAGGMRILSDTEAKEMRDLDSLRLCRKVRSPRSTVALWEWTDQQ